MIRSLYEKRMVKADLNQKKEKGRNLSQNKNNTEEISPHAYANMTIVII